MTILFNASIYLAVFSAIDLILSFLIMRWSCRTRGVVSFQVATVLATMSVICAACAIVCLWAWFLTV